MGVAIKLDNCARVVIKNLRTEGSDIGIQAKDSDLSVSNWKSQDQVALDLMNCTGSFEDLNFLSFQERPLQALNGADVAREKILNMIEHLPYSDKVAIRDSINDLFTASDRKYLGEKWNRFRENSSQYAAIISCAWQIITSLLSQNQ